MKRTPPPDIAPKPKGQPDTSSNNAEPENTVGLNKASKPVGGVKESDLQVMPPILLEGDEPSDKPKAAPPQEQTSRKNVPESVPTPAALPETYGTGRLSLAARDPRCLYAQWDISAGQQKQYQDLSENRSLELRVYRNTAGGPIISQEAIPGESNHSFVRVAASAAKYVAELGYYPPGGAWKTIATSNPTITPTEVTSSEEPVRFATVTFTQERTAEKALSTAPEPSAKPDELPSGEAAILTQLKPEFPLPRSWREVTAAPVEPVRKEEFGMPVAVVGEEAEGLSGTDEGDQVQKPVGSKTGMVQQWIMPATVPGLNWTEEQKRELEELSGWSFLCRRPLGSQETEELIRAKAHQLGAELPFSGEFLEGESLISSLSLAGAPPEERQRFWLGVNAELVIYGATEPDAAVTIAGKRIRLRSDGTFSYRFSLPDGSYELPVAARSKQGDERIAKLSFYRGTSYAGEVKTLAWDPGLNPPTVENVD